MTVYLLGAGPGDPGLLTVRGAEVLGQADVVVFGHLSARSLLDLAPDHAERIDVGGTAGRAAMPQEEINALLVRCGQAGQTTVRLEDGDPFVFAGGGDEARALSAAGVDFEVVPGIPSALAAPAYAGIPVTVRDSTSFTVVTRPDDPDSPGAAVDWEAVAAAGGTIVIHASGARWAETAEQMLTSGLAPDTPVAAIRRGTRPDQRTIRATLATLAADELEAPSTIVVGAVVGEDLAWFERRPLFGRRVIVTRTRSQAFSLVARLRRLGAATIEIPAIEIVGPEDEGAALSDAVERLGVYDWVVVSSPNGAERLLAELYDARDLGGIGIAAIGPGTAAALASGNLVADLVPERYVAEGLLEVFPEPPEDGGRVLVVRAAEARDALPDGLRAAGWDVDVVAAYRTVAAEITDDRRQQVDAAEVVTFTSSSTVARFVEAFGAGAVPEVVACIGPITAQTARDHGLEVTVVADVHSIDGLVDALVDHFG